MFIFVISSVSIGFIFGIVKISDTQWNVIACEMIGWANNRRALCYWLVNQGVTYQTKAIMSLLCFDKI